MTELKPCPFCGGEAELTGFNAPEYWVWCPSCKASTDAHTGKENAVAAWNTRAERTCENVNEVRENGKLVKRVARIFKCSACGYGIDDVYMTNERDFMTDDWPRYCSSCGAKVVG